MLLSLGEPEPFAPGFDAGDRHGVTVPSCCTAFKGCRDQHLRMLLCVCWCPWGGVWGGWLLHLWDPGRARGSFPLQAASLCPSHPHIPAVPVGMAAGLGKERLDSVRVGSLARIFLVPHHHYQVGRKETFGLERGGVRVFFSAVAPLLALKLLLSPCSADPS